MAPAGLANADHLYGGSGDDSYWVDSPADLVFELPDDGISTVYADIVGAGFYLYANIENLILLECHSLRRRQRAGQRADRQRCAKLAARRRRQ